MAVCNLKLHFTSVDIDNSRYESDKKFLQIIPLILILKRTYSTFRKLYWSKKFTVALVGDDLFVLEE